MVHGYTQRFVRYVPWIPLHMEQQVMRASERTPPLLFLVTVHTSNSEALSTLFYSMAIEQSDDAASVALSSRRGVRRHTCNNSIFVQVSTYMYIHTYIIYLQQRIT